MIAEEHKVSHSSGAKLGAGINDLLLQPTGESKTKREEHVHDHHK